MCVIALVVGGIYSTHQPVFIDERTYVVAAAKLNFGYECNVEHPFLVKAIYGLFISQEDKAQLAWLHCYIPSDLPMESLLVKTVVGIRIIQIFLFTLAIILFYFITRDFYLSFVYFLVLYASGFYFEAMLDGWLLTFIALTWALAVKRNRFRALGYLLIPLTKVYGVAAAVFLAAFSEKGNARFVYAAVAIAAIVLFYSGSFGFVAGHYSTSAKDLSVFPRYAIPFLLIVLLERKRFAA